MGDKVYFGPYTATVFGIVDSTIDISSAFSTVAIIGMFQGPVQRHVLGKCCC
jgi:hypothetical protein